MRCIAHGQTTPTDSSPSKGDDPEEMLKQATLGDVDFITGDYLAGKSRSRSMSQYIFTEARGRGEHGEQRPGLRAR